MGCAQLTGPATPPFLPDLLFALLLPLCPAAPLRAGEASPRVHTLLCVPRHTLLQRQGRRLTAPALARTPGPKGPQEGTQEGSLPPPSRCWLPEGSLHFIKLLPRRLPELQCLRPSHAGRPTRGDPRPAAGANRRSSLASEGTQGARWLPRHGGLSPCLSTGLLSCCPKAWPTQKAFSALAHDRKVGSCSEPQATSVLGLNPGQIVDPSRRRARPQGPAGLPVCLLNKKGCSFAPLGPKTTAPTPCPGTTHSPLP